MAFFFLLDAVLVRMFQDNSKTPHMAIPNPTPNRGDADHLNDSTRGEQRSSVPFDLPDSAQDREKLEPEVTTINLPDVSDIPGQEHVTVPNMGAFADDTIASDDEEGTRIFGDDADNGDDAARTARGTEEVGRDDQTVEGTP